VRLFYIVILNIPGRYKIICNLTQEVEDEKKARIEDARRDKIQRMKIEDSRTTLRMELELVNYQNHMLSEEIQRLKVGLEEERKAKVEALVQSQELCEKTVNAEV